MKINEKSNVIILGFLSILAFFTNLGLRPATLMEARNFITAREMVESGNYLVTTLNGNLRFEKPPLPTYFTAFIMKITGNVQDEWLLRIPVAVVGVITILFIYFLVKELTKNSRLSFLSGFVAVTTFMIIKIGNENSWDFYTYAFALGGVLFFVRGLKRDNLVNFLISGVFVGLSFMSKGPVGIYGLMLPFFIGHIFVYGFEDYKRNYKKIILMIVISIVVGGLWWFLIYLEYGDILLQVVKKEERTWSNSHVKSVFYYLDYFIYMGVWIVFSLATYKRDWVAKISEDKKYSRFVFIWQVLVIIALSVIKMKKKRYGIPIFMVSTLGVGNIVYYLYNTTFEKLNKGEKYLVNTHKIFLGILWSGTFGIIGFGALKGIISMYVAFIYGVIEILIFIGYKKDNSLKNLIIISGILFLFVNISSGRILAKGYVKKRVEIANTINMRELHNNPPKYEIYSVNFGIEDVWRVGKSIKSYKAGEILPDEMLFFNAPTDEVLERYKVVSRKAYENERNEVVDIYYLVRKEVIK